MNFAVRALKMTDATMPRAMSGRTVPNQVARSGCSVAANYRAALGGKLPADLFNKIATVLEEAEETSFWIELSERTNLIPAKRLKAIFSETEALTKIFNATRTTAQNHKS